MKAETFYAGKGIVADINVTELFVAETIARDAIKTTRKSARRTSSFGRVDLWNIRRQRKPRRSVLDRVL